MTLFKHRNVLPFIPRCSRTLRQLSRQHKGLMPGDIMDLRSAASGGLPCRIDCQRGDAVPPVKRRLLDHNDLGFPNWHQMRQAIQPPTTSPKVPFAQQIANVPITHDVQAINRRQEQQRPQTEPIALQPNTQHSYQTQSGGTFNRTSANSPSGNASPSAWVGLQIREKTWQERIDIRPA